MRILEFFSATLLSLTILSNSGMAQNQDFWIEPTAGFYDSSFNWQDGTIPTTIDVARFSDPDSVSIAWDTITGDRVASGVVIENGDILFRRSGSFTSFTLQDDLTIENGTLTLDGVFQMHVMRNVSVADQFRVTDSSDLVVDENFRMSPNLGDNSSVTLADPGTTLMVGGEANIALRGFSFLSIENGAVMNTDSRFHLGLRDFGVMVVDGADSELHVGSVLDLGSKIFDLSGSGSLDVINGGLVTADFTNIGFQDDSTGFLVVTNPNSRLETPDIVVGGVNGMGNVFLLDSGSITTNSLSLGDRVSSFGAMSICDPGTVLRTGELNIGRLGTGEMSIENGARVSGTVESPMNIRIGDVGFGSLNLIGPESEVVCDQLDFGPDGSGCLRIDGCATLFANDVNVRDGANVTVTGTGAQLLVANDVDLDFSLSVTDGGRLNCNNLSVSDCGDLSLSTPNSDIAATGDIVVAGFANFGNGCCQASNFDFQSGCVVTINSAQVDASGMIVNEGSVSVRGSSSEIEATGGIRLDGGDWELNSQNTLVRSTISSFGGNLICRAGSTTVIEGDLEGADCTIEEGSSLTVHGDVFGLLSFLGNGSLVIEGQLDSLFNDTAGVTIGGNLQLQNSSNFHVELAGDSISLEQYDFLCVGGNIELQGGLSVSTINGFQPEDGDSFLIGLVEGLRIGTFSAQPEGSSVGVFGGVELFITYQAGDGNDIELFAVANGVLFGDVNLDGVVNILDVGPFVSLISTGQFQIEADINQDGTIDILDVTPFVDLLSG